MPQEWTFLVSTGGRRNVGEERTIIGSHVSRHLRNQKRKHNRTRPTLALKKHTESHTFSSSQSTPPAKDEHRWPYPLLQQQPLEVLNFGPLSDQDQYQEDDLFPTKIVDVKIHPETFLGQGNSDPFHSFNFDIDATVVGLLRFVTTCFIPSLSNTVTSPVSVRGGLSPQSAMAIYIPCTPGVLSEDLCKGYGYLVSSSVPSITAHVKL